MSTEAFADQPDPAANDSDELDPLQDDSLEPAGELLSDQADIVDEVDDEFDENDFDEDFDDDFEEEIEGEYDLEDDQYGEDFNQEFGHLTPEPKDDLD